jgi:hypothetical protein
VCRYAKAIDAEDLENIRSQVAHPMSTPLERLSVVRFVCTTYFFTGKQGAKLLGEMDHGRDRVEAAAALFPRVLTAVDDATDDTAANQKNNPNSLNDLLAPLAPSEQEEFFQRIGIHASFRPANPTGHYRLDLSLPMDYQIANKLVALSVADGGGALHVESS